MFWAFLICMIVVSWVIANQIIMLIKNKRKK